MSSATAWGLSLAVFMLALVASMFIQRRLGRKAMPEGVFQQIGFFAVQAGAIYLALSYAVPLLHPQGSGEPALAGAFAASATVLAQLLFGRCRA